MKLFKIMLLLCIIAACSFAIYKFVFEDYLFSIPTQENSTTSESVLSEQKNSEISEEPESSTPSSSKSTVSYSDSQFNSLDNTSLGWGQGLNKNAKNQPIGSINYQNKYGTYDAYYIAEDQKVVYLTFDEGYENGFTPSILDTLKAKDVKAVFFVTYDFAKRQPNLIRRMIDEGHTVGNHSKSHSSLPTLSLTAARDDTMFLHNYVKDNFQYEMTLYRFPQGAFSVRMLALIQSLGYKSVFWSYAYKDWVTTEQIGKEAAYQKVVSNLHNGAIYLLHAVSSDNASMLGDFIDEARRQGYAFKIMK